MCTCDVDCATLHFQAQFVGLESQSEFDAFGDMELPANASAVAALAAAHPAPVLFFPTDRRFQVRCVLRNETDIAAL